MKKTIYRVLTVILIFALIAGLSTAYAESSKDCTGQKGPAGPDDAYYYSFSLEASGLLEPPFLSNLIGGPVDV